MIDNDAAYAHYMAQAYRHLEDVGLPPRWKVTVCLPGEDDKVVPYYAQESSFMCDLLTTQTQLGHDTYVEWIDS